MNQLKLIRRLQSFGRGKPLPYGKTKHLSNSPDSQCLLLAFLRMGGESAPWGIGWKRPGKAAKFAAVPEPRDRDAVAEMLAGDFVTDLATHLLHPSTTDREFAADDLPGHRQLWLPGPSHVEMLHLIAMAYAFAKKGPPDRVNRLRLLGRTANFLFIHSTRPGQQTVVDATALLRSAYEFPADDLRQSHLGFLLAWLNTPGTAVARLDAAARAEREAVSTALEPAIDKDELEPALAAFNVHGGGREGPRRPEPYGGTEKKQASDRIRAVLERELAKRLALVEAARDAYRRDARPQNIGLGSLVEESRRDHFVSYLRPHMAESAGKPGCFPSTTTDRDPTAAAAHYLRTEAADSQRLKALVDADDDLLDELLAGGEGFVGTLQQVRDVGATGATGRTKAEPIWTVETVGMPPLRLRSGDEVALQGFQKRTARIQEVSPTDKGRRFVLRVVGFKGRPKDRADVPAATDPQLEGRRVTFVRIPNPFFDLERANQVRFGNGPGGWLIKDLGVDQIESATEDEA